MRRAIGALVLAALLGCAVALPEPTREMAGGDDAVLEDLRQGRGLYRAKCAGCHALKEPAAHADGEWRHEVDEMIRLKKVRFAAGEREKILLYLTSANGKE
jgi:mono/diheme cytochrome c family protein